MTSCRPSRRSHYRFLCYAMGQEWCQWHYWSVRVDQQYRLAEFRVTRVAYESARTCSSQRAPVTSATRHKCVAERVVMSHIISNIITVTLHPTNDIRRARREPCSERVTGIPGAISCRDAKSAVNSCLFQDRRAIEDHLDRRWVADDNGVFLFLFLDLGGFWENFKCSYYRVIEDTMDGQ